MAKRETAELSIGGWMSTAGVSLLLRELESKGLSQESLLDGTGYSADQLLDPDGRISWRHLALIGQKALDIWSEDELVELGRRSLDTPAFSRVHASMGWLSSADDLYHTSARLYQSQCNVLDVVVMRLSPEKLLVEEILRPGFSIVPMVAYFTRGVYQALPKAQGLAPVEVELTISSGIARYLVDIDAGRGVLQSLRRWWTRPKRMRQASEEVLRAYDLLQRRYTALEQQEDRFRHVIEASPAGLRLFELDETKRLSFSGATAKADELLGIEHHPLVGQRLELAFPEMASGEVARRCRIAAVHGDSWTGTRIQANDDGTIERALEIRVFPVSDREIAVSYLDITDREKSRRDRDAVIEQLAAQKEELERFAYTVSHDLKAPLVTILGFLGFLEQDAIKRPERLARDVESIRNAAGQMQELLEGILHLSRIGRMVNPSETVPVGSLARQAVALVQGAILEGRVKVEIADDLPSVHGDRQRLVQVFQNLVDNAVKYRGDHDSPRLEIGMRHDGDEPVFFVRDNGVGIDPLQQDKVFGLFQQLDRRQEGCGLGLALVKRIVELHEGRIWVESEGVGKGSTFCLTLPVVDQT